MKDLVDALERRLAIERAARQKAQALLEASAKALHELQQQQDETIRRHTEEARAARDEALAASAAKSAFLANMSHEIRTPLTSIIGFGELLLDTNQGAVDPREALSTIVRNGRHLLEVVNDILDLAKIETSQIDLEQVEVPLALLLRDLTSLVNGRAEERGLKFAVRPQFPLPEVVRSDPVRLKQILLNFCSNAIKFTRAGTVTLEIRYDVESRRLTFAVIDTGIGMTTEQVSRLFQPFMQADLSTTRKFGGTGLGLYISAQLARMLGGELHVQSEPGRGSRFEFEIQLPTEGAPPALLTMEGDLIDYGHADFAITAVSVPDLQGRVLLGEDGEDNRRLLSAYLTQAGLSVTCASDGRDVLNRALADEFDIVLMDIQMPVLDGMQATRRLRAAGYRRPIIALTANVLKGDIQRYRDAGCDDVLAKPIDRELFYEVISAHLGMGGPVRSSFSDSAYARELAQLAGLFRAGLPAQVDAVREALRTHDRDGLQGLMHTLKGTAGSYGYGRLTEWAAEVESELAANRWERAAMACEGLILEANRVLQDAG